MSPHGDCFALYTKSCAELGMNSVLGYRLFKEVSFSSERERFAVRRPLADALDPEVIKFTRISSKHAL